MRMQQVLVARCQVAATAGIQEVHHQADDGPHAEELDGRVPAQAEEQQHATRQCQRTDDPYERRAERTLATRVGAVRRIVVASPDYLARRGTPQVPADLEAHAVVAFSGIAGVEHWLFRAATGEVSIAIQPRLVVTTAEAAMDAARTGVGLTRVLSYQAADDVARAARRIRDDHAQGTRRERGGLRAGEAAGGRGASGDVQRRASVGRRFEPGETLPLHGGIEIHETHGHTVGHVSLLLPAERILIAGDALNNRAGMGGSSPEYTADPADARAAVAALAALRPDTIVFGHGPSIVGGAAAQLEALDASLGS